MQSSSSYSSSLSSELDDGFHGALSPDDSTLCSTPDDSLLLKAQDLDSSFSEEKDLESQCCATVEDLEQEIEKVLNMDDVIKDLYKQQHQTFQVQQPQHRLTTNFLERENILAHKRSASDLSSTQPIHLRKPEKSTQRRDRGLKEPSEENRLGSISQETGKKNSALKQVDAELASRFRRAIPFVNPLENQDPTKFDSFPSPNKLVERHSHGSLGTISGYRSYYKRSATWQKHPTSSQSISLSASSSSSTDRMGMEQIPMTTPLRERRSKPPLSLSLASNSGSKTSGPFRSSTSQTHRPKIVSISSVHSPPPCPPPSAPLPDLPTSSTLDDTSSQSLYKLFRGSPVSMPADLRRCSHGSDLGSKSNQRASRASLQTRYSSRAPPTPSKVIQSSHKQPIQSPSQVSPPHSAKSSNFHTTTHLSNMPIYPKYLSRYSVEPCVDLPQSLLDITRLTPPLSAKRTGEKTSPPTRPTRSATRSSISTTREKLQDLVDCLSPTSGLPPPLMQQPNQMHHTPSSTVLPHRRIPHDDDRSLPSPSSVLSPPFERTTQPSLLLPSLPCLSESMLPSDNHHQIVYGFAM